MRFLGAEAVALDYGHEFESTGDYSRNGGDERQERGIVREGREQSDGDLEVEGLDYMQCLVQSCRSFGGNRTSQSNRTGGCRRDRSKVDGIETSREKRKSNGKVDGRGMLWMTII